jgi:acyl-coenzyme A synthetase/AMP-(fatty) acid ligase
MISVLGLNTLSGFLFGLAALWLGRSVCFAEPAIARNLIAVYKHHYLVGTAQDFDQMAASQAAQFIGMPALRGAQVTGQRFSPGAAARWLELISSNTVLTYNHPALGIVAYGLASRFKDIAGAAGFVAPWVEAQVVRSDGAPAAPEQEGDLRFRDRGDQTGGSEDQSAEWTYPGQRARLMRNRLLVLS